MKQNRFSLKMFKYELWNASSNIFTLFFGIAFPLIMTILFSTSISQNVPDRLLPDINAALFFVCIMIIPLSVTLVGHALNCSQELENGTLQRFVLFGYKERTLIFAKLLANLIFLVVAIFIYSVVVFAILDITSPTFTAYTVLLIFLIFFGTALFILGHAIASLIGKYGSTFGIIMTINFWFLIIGGMMGVRPSQFPGIFHYISRAFPMYYFNEGFIEFWKGNSYDFRPLIITTCGLYIIGFGLIFINKLLKVKGGYEKT
jgi:ABC-2 type transport system permease protein